VEPLDKLVPTLEAADQIRAIMALGRAGAASKLVPYLTHEQIGPAAVAALASAPSKAAREKIEEGLSSASAPTRRAFVRAGGAARAQPRRRGVGPDGRAHHPRVVEGPRRPRARLARPRGRSARAPWPTCSQRQRERPSPSPSRSSRGRPAARSLDRRKISPCSCTSSTGPTLARSSPKQIAAGMALLSSDAADQLSFLTLLQLAEAGGAPRAAGGSRAAAPRRRLDEGAPPRAARRDRPSVRVGLALGLAESAHKPAVTWAGERLRPRGGRLRSPRPGRVAGGAQRDAARSAAEARSRPRPRRRGPARSLRRVSRASRSPRPSRRAGSTLRWLRSSRS
jgi:hypothetical protein